MTIPMPKISVIAGTYVLQSSKQHSKRHSMYIRMFFFDQTGIGRWKFLEFWYRKRSEFRWIIVGTLSIHHDWCSELARNDPKFHFWKFGFWAERNFVPGNEIWFPWMKFRSEEPNFIPMTRISFLSILLAENQLTSMCKHAPRCYQSVLVDR